MWFRVLEKTENAWIPVLTTQADYQRARASLETFRRSGKNVRMLFASNQQTLDTLTINYREHSVQVVKRLREELSLHEAEAFMEATPVDAASDPLIWQRIAMERGPGGDRDEPYVFALPETFSQRLAWAKLLGKVQRGELEP